MGLKIMDIKRNIKCEFSYDGTEYHGLQIQPNQRTIQGELEKSIYKLSKEKVNIIASGRTDAGVHARKQVCNFITDSKIPAEKWKDALNSVLPSDIIVLNTEEVPLAFHSRFDVTKKVYRYYLLNNKNVDIFRRNFTWHYPYPLNLGKMIEASKIFLGEHDFTSFSSVKADIEDKTRIIYESDIWEENNEIIFQISGNGFLYNMVRIIFGTIVEIGSNKLELENVGELLKVKNRSLAGKTAPARGLVLWDIFY